MSVFPRTSQYDSSDPTLEVYLLGMVDFDAACFLQERLIYEISGRDDCFGGLLLCEHPPLITVGREGSRAHIAVEPRELTSRQIDVRWLNRGGGCVVHGPGQLAVYPVIPLKRMGFGLQEYRQRLADSLIAVCHDLRVPADFDAQHPGLICRHGRVAEFGLAVKSWVSWHGAFLNVSPSMELLRLVNAGARVSSLSVERMRQINMSTVRESVVRHVAAHLGYDQHYIFTGHPLLTRTRQTVYAPA